MIEFRSQLFFPEMLFCYLFQFAKYLNTLTVRSTKFGRVLKRSHNNFSFDFAFRNFCS